MDLPTLIAHELRTIAPEADLDALAPDVPLREALDVDSFDFLRLLVALSEATGVEVPEADYGQLDTLAALTRYFEGRLPGR